MTRTRDVNLIPSGEYHVWSNTALEARRRDTRRQPSPNSGQGTPSAVVHCMLAVLAACAAAFAADLPADLLLGPPGCALWFMAALGASAAPRVRDRPAMAAAIRLENATAISGGMRHRGVNAAGG
eukprot:scaffold40072_cov25-Tisochrysis_lutea.AAC.6